jgi:hypothetical protein
MEFKELTRELIKKYPNWSSPSTCSHIDVGGKYEYECIKCGRKVEIDEKGIKRFFMANGYQYLTKIPKSMRRKAK